MDFIYDDIFMNAWLMSHVSKTEEVNFYIDKFKKKLFAGFYGYVVQVFLSAFTPGIPVEFRS